MTLENLSRTDYTSYDLAPPPYIDYRSAQWVFPSCDRPERSVIPCDTAFFLVVNKDPVDLEDSYPVASQMQAKFQREWAFRRPQALSRPSPEAPKDPIIPLMQNVQRWMKYNLACETARARLLSVKLQQGLESSIRYREVMRQQLITEIQTFQRNSESQDHRFALMYAQLQQ